MRSAHQGAGEKRGKGGHAPDGEIDPACQNDRNHSNGDHPGSYRLIQNIKEVGGGLGLGLNERKKESDYDQGDVGSRVAPEVFHIA